MSHHKQKGNSHFSHFVVLVYSQWIVEPTNITKANFFPRLLTYELARKKIASYLGTFAQLSLLKVVITLVQVILNFSCLVDHSFKQ